MTFAAALAAIGLIDRPAEHVGATDTTTVLPPVRRGRYIPKHRDPRTADWKPAHTVGRHRAEHARPAGTDRWSPARITSGLEDTKAIDLTRLEEIAAGGAPCGS